MSLSAHDRQALDVIEASLAGSDPRLAALLDAFSRLADGEGTPRHERIQGRGRRAVSMRWAVPAAWLVISLMLIVTAVVVSHTHTSATCIGFPPAVTACGTHATPRPQTPSQPGFPG